MFDHFAFQLLLTGFFSGLLCYALLWVVFRTYWIRLKTEGIGKWLNQSDTGQTSESKNNLESAIFNPENTNTFKVILQDQINEFLENRLATAMPVLAVFMDELLIEELKQVFAKEMEEKLPEIIQSFSTHIKMNGKSAANKIAEQLFFNDETEQRIFFQVRKLGFAFILIGIFTGLVMSLITGAL